ncbi:PorT family protein [Chitinophaga pendula]|uniref:outer membrane beta-barrel protein n=1 Tax=Chitinophaga TaxID=79328 RepID=UPI000BAECDDE|nr:MULTISPECIES: outer membrane beta-barrel protein [Chitinophaga]ASZ10357.1 hypothetical protein CK934_04850 [Chitinophaga sp. MD30]UCJ06680.1 PorT family protein [Chitinophaga pendula]
MKDAFENKIREKLEKAEQESFDPIAWEKMKAQLDATGDDDKTGAFWWWWIPVLVLLLAGGIFIWPGGILLNKHSSTPVAAQLSVSDKHPSSATSLPLTKDRNDHSTQKNISRTSAYSNTGSDLILGNGNNGKVDDPSISSGAHHGQQQAITTSITPAKKGISTASTVPGHRPPVLAAVSGQHQATASPSEGAQIPEYSQTNTTVVPNTAAIPNTIQAIASLFPQEPEIATGLTLQRPTAMPVKETTTVVIAGNKSRKEPQVKGIGVGLSLGADYNSAPSLKYGKIKPNFGLSVNYYFNNRWSVSTGLVYSKKSYGATPSDYKLLKKLPPPSSPYYVVKKVDADCIVLDVPINVNYTFAEKNRHRWTATAGLSSYFMIRENYCYIYAWATPKEIELNNKNQHYLSILNLGITYQYSLGKHTTLGLQPYAKIPLRPIGFGEINLFSAGAAIQLNLHGRR